MSRVRGEGATRWDRLTDGTARRWDRLADRVLGGWDHLADRTARRWDRLADRALGRWDRFAGGTAALGDRVADGWSRWTRVLRRPIVVAGVMGAALSVAAGIVVFQMWTGDATRPRGSDRGLVTNVEPQPSAPPSVSIPSDSEITLPGLDVHVNEAAGYLFSYPSSWEIGRQGNVDRLRDPSGDVLMTFEVAPSGTLHSASDTVVDKIAGRYSQVELDTGPIERTPQGLPSLVVGGHGIGPGGATARFLVITIQGADGNRAIAVHFSPDAQPLEALPVIREVIASYRISTAD
jgi:hypothetical protein